jgi:N-glycosylase/DNA lyase
MLVVTALIFITLAMKGGSYVYYFNNYVDETSLKNFISPITAFFSSIG